LQSQNFFVLTNKSQRETGILKLMAELNRYTQSLSYLRMDPHNSAEPVLRIVEVGEGRP